MTTITGVRIVDLRFPTALMLDGSDAMNPDPDYSAAYCILDTDDAGLSGHGLTFTIGRGNEICCAAIEALAPFKMEYTTDRNAIAKWAPLLVEGRDDVPITATKMDGCSDLNFGAISGNSSTGFPSRMVAALLQVIVSSTSKEPQAAGVSLSKTWPPAPSFTIAPDSSSSAPAEAACHCSKNPASQRARDWVDFPSADNGWFVKKSRDREQASGEGLRPGPGCRSHHGRAAS